MSLETIPVSEYMSKNVKTIEFDQPLYSVCKIMKDNQIGSVIVIKEDDPIGIITERDIVHYIQSENSFVKVESHIIMSKPIITLYETNSVKDALQTMQTNNFRRLAIINRDGKLVGIITDKDIFRAIISNEQLLTSISSDKNFQLPPHTIEYYRDELFKGIS